MKVSKSILFLVKSFLGNFYRHLAIFSGHTVSRSNFSLPKNKLSINMPKLFTILNYDCRCSND